MKSISLYQEVLLMTGSGFASRQYIEREPTDSLRNLPEIEKLKEACWNGLLKEMLPELFILNDPTSKLYLWQVREANRFIAIEMGEFPTGIDNYFSIDPYRFIETQAAYN